MTETDREKRARLLGGFDAFADVLSYLNTLETKAVEKKTIYAAVMAMQPKTFGPDLTTPRYITDWTEDDGDVLWWHYPIQEPPYVGSPLDTNFEANWHTWWTPLPDVNAIAAKFEERRTAHSARLSPTPKETTNG